MTFAALLADCYARLNYAAAPAAAVVTRLKANINETQQELAAEPALTYLMRNSITFASVATQQSYGLPPVVARILTLRETTTKRRLYPMSLDRYRALAPDPSVVNGTASYYVPLGPQSVALQPSDASQLWVVSTSASDTGTIYFECVRTGGFIRNAFLTMTGITPVAFPSFSDFVEVRDWYYQPVVLTDAAAGSITLNEDSGIGTELARIPPGSVRSRYEGVALYPTPASAITYTADYERDVTDLQSENDEPYWLPVRFHRILSIGARMKEYEKTADARYENAARQFAVARQQLLAYVNNEPGKVLLPTRGASTTDLSSTTGYQFPAGTIWD